jgi:hypothetical protein
LLLLLLLLGQLLLVLLRRRGLRRCLWDMGTRTDDNGVAAERGCNARPVGKKSKQTPIG